MDKAEWLASTDPAAMLHYLQYAPVGVGGRLRGTAEGGPVLVSPRKLRLFACACCRRVMHLLTDARSRRAVEVAERYADGPATEEELLRAERHGHNACIEGKNRPQDLAEACHLAHALCRPVLDVPRLLSGSEFGRPPPATQAAFLRCIAGNPFRPVVLPWNWNPTPGTWNHAFVVKKQKESGSPWVTPTVEKIARRIYDERDFDALPILADALEDAGCTNTAVLVHCRAEGVHVRGCWCVDLLLGKE